MVKKRTKHFPFLKIQQQRFHLHYDNQSQAQHLPSEHQFYQWMWLALKPFYYHAQLSLLLLDELPAREYNLHYRGKDYATNILSFALNESESVMPAPANTLYGDLIICPEVVEREAKEQNKPLLHHYAHLAIHGTLHLIGFDHIQEEDAHVMETLEIKLLAQLNINNPYDCS